MDGFDKQALIDALNAALVAAETIDVLIDAPARELFERFGLAVSDFRIAKMEIERLAAPLIREAHG